MATDDLKSENDNLKYELNKLDNLYEKLQEQVVNLLNFGEMAIVECDMDYKIISTYGAVDPIFRNLNKFYAKYKNLIEMLNNCINTIDDEDVDLEEGQEPFYKVDIKNVFMSFIQNPKKTVNIDLFGKLPTDEIYNLNIKLMKTELSITAYIRFLPSSFFLKKYEQKIKNDLISKDLLITNVFNSINHGMTLLDSRYRILLMNQNAKDHHISDEAKILKNAQLEGRLYRDIFTNETNEEYNERHRNHEKAISSMKKVKFSKKTNGKMVHFELTPLMNEVSLPEGMIIFTSIEMPNDLNMELKVNKLTQLAKHFKSENDGLNERVKELELNQNWLMKKNDESTNNTKLLHESLRQIYFYLELLPFPMAIIELPSGKYQFVNNEFLKLVKLEKISVLSKIDDQIFPDTIAAQLVSKTAESINTGKTLSFEFMGSKCKQYIVKINNSNHLLRIFNID